MIRYRGLFYSFHCPSYVIPLAPLPLQMHGQDTVTCMIAHTILLLSLITLKMSLSYAKATIWSTLHTLLAASYCVNEVYLLAFWPPYSFIFNYYLSSLVSVLHWLINHSYLALSSCGYRFVRKLSHEPFTPSIAD